MPLGRRPPAQSDIRFFALSNGIQRTFTKKDLNDNKDSNDDRDFNDDKDLNDNKDKKDPWVR